MKKALSFFALFGSTATLLCCAVPALLVFLGFGSALAGLFGAFPGLAGFTETLASYKGFLFVGTGLLLGGLALDRFRRPTPEVCAVGEGTACGDTRRWTGPLLLAAGFVYLVGVLFSYVLPSLL